MAEPILSVEDVTREFGERVRTRALNGVSFVVRKAEFVALIGPSGSGKSSLLNIIGLLDRPTSGRVVLDGVDTSAVDAGTLTALRARKLGFVFQFHHLLPAFSALENVMLPAWADEGFAAPGARDAALQLLAAVGLGERAQAKSSDLSGGQQQRVAIARALSRQPGLILADEPTGNLDTQSADEVFALLQRFNRELGTTFLIVTHDTRIADRCERVIELVDGKVRRDESSRARR